MKRFLIIKPSSLGDVLHAFPAAYRIMAKARRDFPEEEILLDWVISPAFRELLDFLPFPGAKILFDRQKLGRFSTFPKEFFSLLKDLRKRGKYDAVYDLQGLLRSALIGALAPSREYYGSRTPREKAAGLFYSRKLDPGPATAHAAEKLLQMTDPGWETEKKEDFLLPVHKEFRERALEKAKANGMPHLERLSGEKKIIAVTPGARWESKEWPAAFFADACKKLSADRPGTEFLILGSGTEREKGEVIREALQGHAPCCNLCGMTSIGELTELIRFSSLLLCNDSGPMHIGAFCNTPIVALFGPTDPVLTGPWCRKKRVLQANLPCRCCFKRVCPRSLECQKAVSPLAAAKAAEELLCEKSI